MDIFIQAILSLVAFLVAGIYIYRRKLNGKIRCPHCGTEQIFVHSLFREIKNGGNCHLIVCSHCEKSFQIKPTLGAIGSNPCYVASKIDDSKDSSKLR